MTVTIVDPTPDPSVVKHVICRKCGVKLAYVPNDIKTYKHTDYTGDTDTYHYILCANCNDKVHVKGY